MNIPALLHECQGLGMRVVAKDGRLHVTSTKGSMTPELSASLKENKSAIIEYLTNPSFHSENRTSPRSPRIPPPNSGNLDKNCGKSEECQADPVGNLGGLGGLGNLLNEDYEERAAIIEHDGGLDRPAAEVLAKGLCNGSAIESWAFIEPDGRVLVDSVFKTAADAWQIGLGWPDDSEIESAKQRGYQVEQVTIVRDINRP